MEWETLAISLASGLAGAVLVCIANLAVQDRRDKRQALKDYFRRWTNTGGSDIQLLNEVFISFSHSLAVRKCFQELRKSGWGGENRRKALKAMCKSAKVRYDEVLMGYDGPKLYNEMRNP